MSVRFDGMRLVKPNIEICSDPLSLAKQAAQMIATQAHQAVAANNRFIIALSGGSTPRRLYELMADSNAEYREQLPWQRIHFFWSDERPVAPQWKAW